MANQVHVITRGSLDSVLQTNLVIRNTYLLLGASLLFSAIMAGIAMATNAAPHPFLSLLLYFGLLLFINVNRNNALGIAGVFALTGVLGYTLGPILNAYAQAYVNGHQLIVTALGGTGLVFFALSAYALTTRKDFSYLGGFLAVLGMVLFVALIAQLFLHLPVLQLVLSAGFVLFSSGIILFETSQIINGGQRNYVLATVSIFLALYNLFTSLLQLLAAFASNRD